MIKKVEGPFQVMFYYFFRAAGRLFWRLTVGHYIKGLENLPRDRGVILCSNHASYLDPPLIAMGTGVLSPQLNFMARDSLFKNPFFGYVILLLNTFPVRRGGADREAWREFEKRIGEKRWVLFFPEGTRSPDGSLQPANPGSGMLIHRCKDAAVVPVRIFGQDRIWPRGQGLRGFFPVAVTFGKPLDLSEEFSRSGGRETYQAIADKVMAGIAALEPHPAYRPAGTAMSPKKS